MDFQQDIEHCIEILGKGGLILYPTDTIWGIGCDATSEVAVGKIFDIKKRPDKKSLIILLADPKEILRYVSHPDPRIFEFLAQVQKPTTVIYEGAIHVADSLVGEDGSIAIRLVTEPFCKHLIKRFRKPIVSTSANVSGQPPPRFFAEISREIVGVIDYAVAYRQDDRNPSQPSSVVKLLKDGTIDYIRR
jgi:L-threonylcarbamoyladenylate synthase